MKPSAITTRPNTNHRNAESDDDEQYNTNVGYDESQDSYDAFDRFDDFANVNLLTPKGVFQSAAKKILQQNRVSKIIQDAELEESMLRYVRTISAAQVSKEAKAAKILELLINQFEHYFLMARHLELIVLLFHEFGQLKHTEFFGTYRTELVVSLFSCVVDLYNFEIVMRALNPYECATVICRIGYLHIFNPMKPEGSYEFDLSRREERLIVKMLAQLATAEPGDNLPELCFRWERTMDHMPGRLGIGLG